MTRLPQPESAVGVEVGGVHVEVAAEAGLGGDEVEAGQDAFIAALKQDSLAEPLSYVSFAGDSFTRELGDALLHLANHGTYHRGQVATLLRMLGHTATSTDYLRYIDAQKS